MSIDVNQIKLGKKAGRVEDDRHFRVRQIARLAGALPSSWEIAVKLEEVDGWGMFANDELGDCTCASICHGSKAMEWNSGQRNREPIKLVDRDAVELYQRLGYVPGHPETDQGAYLIDALKLWRSVGVGHEADSTRHTIVAYAQVASLPSTYAGSVEFRYASRLFGGAYVGLALPTTSAREIGEGKRWDDVSGEPYSWGGHAVWCKGWDEHGVTFVTWGAEQRASWRWVAKYLDEAWVVVSEDIFNSRGVQQQGLDVAALTNKLEAL